MWNLDYAQMNLSMKQIYRHRQAYGYQVQGIGGGMKWEVGVSRCKPLYIEQINDKVLLYSTDNYIKYRMINSRKEYEKVYTYTHN